MECGAALRFRCKGALIEWCRRKRMHRHGGLLWNGNMMHRRAHSVRGGAVWTGCMVCAAGAVVTVKYMWRGQPFTCGRNPAYREIVVLERCFSPAVL